MPHVDSPGAQWSSSKAEAAAHCGPRLATGTSSASTGFKVEILNGQQNLHLVVSEKMQTPVYTGVKDSTVIHCISMFPDVKSNQLRKPVR